MKSEFIRNEWVGDESCITIMNQSREMKNAIVVLMNDYGDFDICAEDKFDYKLERDYGNVHVIFAAPIKSIYSLVDVEYSFANKLRHYIFCDDFNGSYGWYHAPVSVVKDIVLGRKHVFNYPQIDRFDLVKELYEQ